MENVPNGTYAMVNPQVENDPAKRQGMVGMIVDTNIDNDDIWVSFGKSEVGLYSTNALMVLQKPDIISQNAMDKRFEISGADFKQLMEISLLQADRRPENAKTALEMARSSEAVMQNSLTTLQDKLGLELNYEMAAGRRR
ncbi:hypothetical protein SAMN05216464_1254 [Mucilaginibacter pineti]|uniref:Uncharacterized protein n=1 Tax=Mucilaginibacter pineti TaxID=1391627 RepID=A0A1G7N6L7_9SPHI|nr:hypothetical protein [Mucilaginibacter pineti]SDF69596.1 hypothetical protein SAMN05216464_1254 [Mucilaginibacter pineti]